MNAPDASEMVVMTGRYAAQLQASIVRLRAEGLSPATIGELIGLKAHTVRRMMLDWRVE